MNELEMLMLAAKAAGLKVIIPATPPRGLWIEGLEDEWNPLTDDGDALRLAVKLDMSLVMFSIFVRVDTVDYTDIYEEYGTDRYAATRRAIVRAAAQIGEHMEKQNGN